MIYANAEATVITVNVLSVGRLRDYIKKNSFLIGNHNREILLYSITYIVKVKYQDARNFIITRM